MFIANYLLSPLYDNLSFQEFPLPPLTIVSKTLSDTEKFPRKHVQGWLCSLARAQPGTQAGREGKRDSEYREAQPFREPQEFSSSDPFTRGSSWCLDLNPRKIFRTGWPGYLKTLPDSPKGTEPRPTNRRDEWYAVFCRRGTNCVRVTTMWASKCLQSSATEKPCDYGQSFGEEGRVIGVLLKNGGGGCTSISLSFLIFKNRNKNTHHLQCSQGIKNEYNKSTYHRIPVLAWVEHRNIQNMVAFCKKLTVCLTKIFWCRVLLDSVNQW